MLFYLSKSSTFVAVALACCLAVCGCSSDEKQVVGKWKVDPTKLPATIASGPAAAALKGYVSSIHIEFKSDHTYTAKTSKTTQQGTWTLDGNTVTLTSPSTKRAGSNDEPPPGKITVNDDGKSLTMLGPNQADSLTFIRDSS